MKYLILILSLLCLTGLLYSHQKVSGNEKNVNQKPPPVSQYVEFLQGDFPIILEAPHGGHEMLHFLEPNPKLGGRDTGTLELTRLFKEEIRSLTGKYPSMIVMLANRNYIDANRPPGPEAYRHDFTKELYEYYYEKIDRTISDTARSHKTGLLISIHSGWNYPHEFDIGVNRKPEWSTIPVFIEKHGWDTFHGEDGIAGRLYRRGYAAPGFGDVPFSHGLSGYPIRTRCRVAQNIGIDGLQFEFRGSQFLSSHERREKLARDLAEVLVDFVRAYYIDK